MVAAQVFAAQSAAQLAADAAAREAAAQFALERRGADMFERAALKARLRQDLQAEAAVDALRLEGKAADETAAAERLLASAVGVENAGAAAPDYSAEVVSERWDGEIKP